MHKIFISTISDVKVETRRINSDLKHPEEFCEILVAKKTVGFVFCFLFSLVSLFCFVTRRIAYVFPSLPFPTPFPSHVREFRIHFFFLCHCPWHVILLFLLIWFSRLVTYNSFLNIYTNTVIVRKLRNEKFMNIVNT